MRTRIYTEEELLDILIPGIQLFYSNEHYLLRDDLCERALVFRLGCLLYSAFDSCSVHSEYNKFHDENGAEPKSTRHQVHNYPDLIVFSNHALLDRNNRPSESCNQLFVEVKKRKNNNLLSDLNKMVDFTDDSYKYKYILGCHLFLDVNCFIIVCYHHGYPYSVRKYEYDYIHDTWSRPQMLEVPAEFEYHSFSELNRMFTRRARR